jgi:hypothetical protein
VNNLGQYAQYANQAQGMLDGMGGPMGFVGRLAGLGTDEMDAGVPGWAWFGIGALAGGVAVYFLHGKIQRVVEG